MTEQLMTRIRYAQIDRFRLILVLLSCIYFFGFPGTYGVYVQSMCCFAPPAFFITSGFLILRESPNRIERIKRTILRSGIIFLCLIAIYTLANYIDYRITGEKFYECLGDSSTWINFLLFNIWPFEIGKSIWVVQSYFYASIILLIFAKKDLLKHDWKIVIGLLLVATIFGEFSGLFRFDIFGSRYISGNFFTRALPYMLIGHYIRERADDIMIVNQLFFWLALILGLIIQFTELNVLYKFGVLVYNGHYIGTVVLSASVCMLVFFNVREQMISPFIDYYQRNCTKCIYYIAPIVSYWIAFILERIEWDGKVVMAKWNGIVTFLISAILMLIFGSYGFKFICSDRREKITMVVTTIVAIVIIVVAVWMNFYI